MKTNHDGTITLNAYDTWISCAACGQRVTGDSIHTCSPQLKTLTDEEIIEVFESPFHPNTTGKINDEVIAFARAILKKASEK
jgi:hypothetical protein